MSSTTTTDPRSPRPPVAEPPAAGPLRDPGPPRGALERLAAWARRRRGAALALWVVVLVATSALGAVVGSDFRNDFALPGTESEEARELLERSGAPAGESLQVVAHDPGGLDVRQRAAVEERLAAVGALPGVARADGLRTRSPDGTTALAEITLQRPSGETPPVQIERIVEQTRAAAAGDLRVELSGDGVRAAEEPEGGAAEGAGLLAALVILVLLFGSLVAASLPLLTAVAAVGTAVALVGLASHVATVADFTTPIVLLVGLGVGIDYALLVFSRYRDELLAGASTEAASAIAARTAGRTVLFAGGTVIVALLGLVVLGLGALQGVAVALALVVLTTMLASASLLPALLALSAGRIERGVRRRAARSEARGRVSGERWARLSDGVARRPWTALVLAGGVLALLCLPALDMRLGFADASTDAPSSTARQAQDIVSERFGPGHTGPLVLVADGDRSAADAAARAVRRAPGVAEVTPPVPTGAGGSGPFVLSAFPETAPQDAATQALVGDLRGRVLPSVQRATGARVLVGGATAATEDFASTVAARMPWFVAIVVGLSTLLLVAVFRSIWVPLKAAALNLLSVGAALGVMTLVFQDGRFGAQAGPIEAFLPVMVFAIVFGLSMDYEVFLVSRIREAWRRTGDPHLAVREGLASTGRVITAAAAIMVVVFAAFLLSPSRMLQQFGLGLATAILLDAVLLRCLVVPAVMHLLGERAWWLPGPVARRLPAIAHDGPAEVPAGR